MQFKVFYNELCGFLIFFNQPHRLCISSTFLHSVKIWSRSDDYIIQLP